MKFSKVQNHMVFPTPLWIIDYEDYETVNQTLIDEIAAVDWVEEHRRLELEQAHEDRYREDYFLTPHSVPSVGHILDAFLENCSQIARELGWDMQNNRMQITAVWAHVTPTGKSTQRHHHYPDHLSCVYYVRTPANCGNLRFVDDRKHRLNEPKSSIDKNVMGKRVEIAAAEGKMILFPSWLDHVVDENQSGEDRISISANMKLMPTDV